MAASARICKAPGCGRTISHKAPQATTCDHACRQKVYRDARRTVRRNDLLRAADAAWRLIVEGRVDVDDRVLALSYVVWPTDRVTNALERVAA